MFKNNIMSSAISNSSARRRRTAQPKVQERVRETAPQPPPPQIQNDYEDENIPILSVKESIHFLSKKIHLVENYIQRTNPNASGGQKDELKNTFQDMKRTIDDVSIKLERLDLSIEKINLVLKLHDTYINKIKNMVEFENVEQVVSSDIKPQLLESTDSR